MGHFGWLSVRCSVEKFGGKMLKLTVENKERGATGAYCALAFVYFLTGTYTILYIYKQIKWN